MMGPWHEDEAIDLGGKSDHSASRVISRIAQASINHNDVF
jgi:hypothetical protein